MDKEEIKKVVRDSYAGIATKGGSCCHPVSPCCVGTSPLEISKKLGYTEEELKAVPDDANLGLGCGNPIALAALREGETVLDLGSGGGFDCFLAAQKVGESGRVIGVDMTPEMIDKARKNARTGNYGNVEFRLGEIENLPAADNSVDVIISNCVINLSPEKKRVFTEAFRVLRPSGRLMVSDVVLLKQLPGFVTQSVEAYVGCLSGAIMREEYIEAIETAGFQDVRIMEETPLPFDCMANDPTAKAVIENFIPAEKINEIKDSIVSIKVYGVKPHRL